jgi:hypothetical protein
MAAEESQENSAGPADVEVQVPTHEPATDLNQANEIINGLRKDVATAQFKQANAEDAASDLKQAFEVLQKNYEAVKADKDRLENLQLPPAAAPTAVAGEMKQQEFYAVLLGLIQHMTKVFDMRAAQKLPNVDLGQSLKFLNHAKDWTKRFCESLPKADAVKE